MARPEVLGNRIFVYIVWKLLFADQIIELLIRDRQKISEHPHPEKDQFIFADTFLGFSF